MANYHITSIEDTLLNFFTDSEHGQRAVLTDNGDTWAWKDDGGTKVYLGAPQGYSTNGSTFAAYSDVHFGEITTHDDILLSEYIKRSGGTDDYIRLQDNTCTIALTGTTAISATNAAVQLLGGFSFSASYQTAPDAAAIGLGAGKATITFNDEATDDITFTNCIVNIQRTGAAKSAVDILELTSAYNAADMDGTGGCLVFNQYYYDAVTSVKVDAGRIAVMCETDWTSTASTQDSYMSFQTALDGTVTERTRINSAGEMLFVNSGVNQPFTDLQPLTTCYGLIQAYSTSNGGIGLSGFSDTDASAVIITGSIGAANPTDTTSAIFLNGQKSNGGTTTAALGNAETILQIANVSIAKMAVLGSGALCINGAGTSLQYGQYLEVNNSANYGGAKFITWSASDEAVLFDICKSKNATIGTHTKVDNGELIGAINFKGSDGTNFENMAVIAVYADGTTGNNDTPGRIIFSTTPDGSTSATERMRIDNAGKLYVVDLKTTEAEHNASDGWLRCDTSTGEIYAQTPS